MIPHTHTHMYVHTSASGGSPSDLSVLLTANILIIAAGFVEMFFLFEAAAERKSNKGDEFCLELL